MTFLLLTAINLSYKMYRTVFCIFTRFMVAFVIKISLRPQAQLAFNPNLVLLFLNEIPTSLSQNCFTSDRNLRDDEPDPILSQVKHYSRVII